MKFLKRAASPSRRCRASLRFAFSLAAVALCSAEAGAESAKVTPQKPVALFVDMPEGQMSAAGELKGKQFDLNGLPIVVGSGPTGGVGVQAGHRVDLGRGFSADGVASAARQVDPNAILSGGESKGQVTAQSTLRFQQSGWDVALSPAVSTVRLAADRLPSYALGGSVAHKAGSGWAVQASTQYGLRHTDMLTEAAGANAQSQFGITRLPVLGATLDLGYLYDWVQPKSGTATLSQGPSVGLDFGLSDTLNCRVGYRYAFAGDPARADFASLSSAGQDLTVGWDWDLAAAGIRGTTFSAGFAYHQDFFAATDEGSGSINLATRF